MDQHFLSNFILFDVVIKLFSFIGYCEMANSPSVKNFKKKIGNNNEIDKNISFLKLQQK